MRRRDFMKASASAALAARGAALTYGVAAARGHAATAGAWKVLRIGAGGFISAVDMALDGTLVARTDTYGGYIWDADTAEWRQLIKASTMPAPFVNVDHHAGVFELVVAPTASDVLYMHYIGHVLRSEDRGRTWSRTGLPRVPEPEPDADYWTFGPKMAVDPRDPNHVIVGTPFSGLFRSVDGGETFSRAADVPAGEKGPGVQNIVFDPSSAVVDGRTSVAFCAVTGGGVYRSADAGATWAVTAGGPPSHFNRVAIASDGTLYGVHDSKRVWRFAGGGWTDLGEPLKDGNIASVSVDPANPARVVVGAFDGQLIQSLDGGSRWSAPFTTVIRSAADIPWLAWTKEDYMTNGDIRFHATSPDTLVFAQGVGVWTTTLPQRAAPGAHTVVWTSQSNGIEQLVANQVLCPPGGKPILAAWDRPIWRVSDPDAYPATHLPDNKTAIVHGWALDYASSDPGFIAGVMGRQKWWEGGEPDIHSGSSSDGGETWRPFASTPPWTGGNGMGTIAASTPENIVWAPTHSRQPYYTLDGGATWSPVNLPGVTSEDYAGIHWAFYLRRHNVCADRVRPNVFYLCHTDRGLFSSLDGGATWTHAFRGPITSSLRYNMKLKAAPGHAAHLWLTGGHQGGRNDYASPSGLFLRSPDGGKSWRKIPGVVEVFDFGFGKARAGGYPAIFVYGWIKGVLGLHRSDDEGQSWTYLTTWPLDSLDMVVCVEGDKDEFGKVYVGFAGSGFAYGAG